MKRVGRFFDIMPVGRIRFRGKLLRRDRGSCVIHCRNLWGFVRRLFLGLWFFLFRFFFGGKRGEERGEEREED